MGASVFAYWPGITKKQIRDQPGFSNDCKAWGNFIANLMNSPKALEAVEAVGAAVTTFKTRGLDDDDVDWVTPKDLESAALVLRDLVKKRDPSMRRVIAVYAKSANEVDPIHVELACDLDDIVSIARWARKTRTKRMTFDINW
jgi:hypothetical protein